MGNVTLTKNNVDIAYWTINDLCIDHSKVHVALMKNK